MERKRKILSVGSFSKYPRKPRLGQAKSRTWNSVQIWHMVIQVLQLSFATSQNRKLTPDPGSALRLIPLLRYPGILSSIVSASPNTHPKHNTDCTGNLFCSILSQQGMDMKEIILLSHIYALKRKSFIQLCLLTNHSNTQ